MTIPAYDEELDVDEVGFHRALKAQKKREPLKADPRTVEDMAVTYNFTTDSANFLLVEHDFPPRLRPFLDVLVGVCGERVGEWFKASDEVLAERADRSPKTISRWREDYLLWMKRSRVALVDVKDHLYKKGETPQPHEYRVNFSTQVAETLLEAEKMPEWKINKGLALKESAGNVRASDLLPAETTHVRRTRRPRGDAEAQIARKIRTAKTLVKRSLDIWRATGKHVLVDAAAFRELEQLVSELRVVVAEQSEDEFLSSNTEEELQDKNPAVRESGAWFGTTEKPPVGGSGHSCLVPPASPAGLAACGELAEHDGALLPFVQREGGLS